MARLGRLSWLKDIVVCVKMLVFALLIILSALYVLEVKSNRLNESASNNADLPLAFGANKPIIPFNRVKSTMLSSP